MACRLWATTAASYLKISAPYRGYATGMCCVQIEAFVCFGIESDLVKDLDLDRGFILFLDPFFF